MYYIFVQILQLDSPSQIVKGDGSEVFLTKKCRWLIEISGWSVETLWYLRPHSYFHLCPFTKMSEPWFLIHSQAQAHFPCYQGSSKLWVDGSLSLRTKEVTFSGIPENVSSWREHFCCFSLLAQKNLAIKSFGVSDSPVSFRIPCRSCYNILRILYDENNSVTLDAEVVWYWPARPGDPGD